MFPVLRSLVLSLTFALVLGASGAQARTPELPGWLQAQVGYGEGQIAPVVLERARDLYFKKRRQGAVRNPCYFAMDATLPSTGSDGQPRERFYIICEGSRTFRAVSSGYGNGRKLPQANFSNGRECARHFSNAEGSNLTMGGEYVTAEARTSFKGYYRQSGQLRPFNRTFVVFEGQGETRNARDRAIGGHRAMFLRPQCRMQLPQSRHANAEGFVPVGRLVDYTSGRSNGCTTWSQSATEAIVPLVDGNPTSLYIYPEGRDITAVARAVQAGGTPAAQGLYWNQSCLPQIGAPQFWPKRNLQPVINRWRRSLPERPRTELPICQ